MDEKETPLCFRVEIGITCPGCDLPVPLDGPLLKTTCIHCGKSLELTPEYWWELLGEGCAEMLNTPVGQGISSTVFGQVSGTVTLGRLNPYCLNCKTDFEDALDLVPGTIHTCGNCGSKCSVSPPPEWLSEGVPGITLLINAMVGRGEDPFSGHSPAPVSCPSCSASLTVDGSTRLVRCSWCDGQVYLSDQVWRALHGTRSKRKWFVVCGGSGHE